MDLCHFQHWNDKPLSSWLCEPRGGAVALAYAHFSVHVPHLKKNMPIPITSLPINTIYSSLWPAHQEVAIMHSHTEWHLPSSNNDSDSSCACILRRSFSFWRLFASDFDASAALSAWLGSQGLHLTPAWIDLSTRFALLLVQSRLRSYLACTLPVCFSNIRPAFKPIYKRDHFGLYNWKQANQFKN